MAVGGGRGLLVFAVAVAVLALSAEATRVGAPYGACNNMVPGHGQAARPASENPGYLLQHNMCQGYQAGRSYDITISGATFRGFFCRLQKKGTVVSTSAVGRWDSRYLPSYTRLSSCDKPSTGATHGGARNWNSLNFKWIAPSSDVGTLQLTCTMAQNYNRFWVALRSTDICFNPSTAAVSCGSARVHTNACPRTTPTRPAGPPGAAGGNTGTCTQTCPAGPPGPTGSRGPQGTRGINGARGPPGQAGPTGSRGSTGQRGPSGPRGAGQKGSKGGQGIQGFPALPGGAGPRGATGRKGDAGSRGERGPPGFSSGPGTSGGTKGDRGERGYIGSRGPPGPIGPPGGGSTGSSRGTQGPVGPPGATGASGRSGSAGPQGPRGAAGYRGPKGERGLRGPSGSTGAPGRNAVFTGPSPSTLDTRLTGLANTVNTLDRRVKAQSASGDSVSTATISAMAADVSALKNTMAALMETVTLLDKKMKGSATTTKCPVLGDCPYVPASTVAAAPTCRCRSPLGVESGVLNNAQFTASTFVPGLEAREARLNIGEAWVPISLNDPYLEIGMGGGLRKLTAVTMQGKANTDYYVTEYTIAVKLRTGVWTKVTENGQTKICKGSFDSTTPVVCALDCRTPLEVTAVRLYPVKYHRHIAMRVELLGCDERV